MNIEILMQYVSYLLIAVGVLACIVSIITQVIKELPKLRDIPTAVVVVIISLILCPISLVAACQYLNIVITWYMVFASFVVVFIVAIVSMSGWDKLREIWDRTRYGKGDLDKE